MFARIMAVVMAAILLTTVGLTAVSWFTLRDQQINARLDALSKEAEDIAYLVSNTSSGVLESYFDSATRRYLNRKAQQVFDEYGAYIAVVDQLGNVSDNLAVAYNEDPEFVASLSGEEISDALLRILGGETIRLQTRIGEDPAFTVGVPSSRGDTVIGAVFIQTRAQRIESGLGALLARVGWLALGMTLLSGILVFFIVRSIMKPLKGLTTAAERMSVGDFTVRVPESGSWEMREVSKAFNTMSGRLEGVEESRREFVANVSHELRSPITSIRGFAEGMADGVIPEEEHPKYLRLLADESRRLSSLVGDLLELSRLEREDAKLNFSVFDMNEMLRRAIIRRMNDLDTKNIETDCDFDTDPCLVEGDSDRIEEVVINLLDNAIKFTPEGGRIELATGLWDNRVRVTVRDNGIGIAKEDRDRVFDRFFTEDRAHTSGKGTGLGLSICQRIMEMHGQSIRLLDTEQGTAFAFTLKKAESGSRAAVQERHELTAEKAEAKPLQPAEPEAPEETKAPEAPEEPGKPQDCEGPEKNVEFMEQEQNAALPPEERDAQ